jgi:hypothetical protein
MKRLFESNDTPHGTIITSRDVQLVQAIDAQLARRAATKPLTQVLHKPLSGHAEH